MEWDNKLMYVHVHNGRLLKMNIIKLNKALQQGQHILETNFTWNYCSNDYSSIGIFEASPVVHVLTQLADSFNI